jgi:hypothetical protein
MTGTPRADDLDRLLGEWLAEGPARTPDPVLARAMAHARSHPRRRDPFAALRRDPMGGGWSLFGLSPVPALAVVALLLAAVVGVAVVGAPRPTSVPLPAATVAPSVSPTPFPTIGPSTGPAPSPIRVTLDTTTAATMTVDVTDESGRLTGASSGPAVEGGSVELGTIAVTNVDASTLRLVWTDAVCDIAYTLTIDATASSIELVSPRCSGDTLPVDRTLDLAFDGPISASGVTATIIPSS